MRVYLNLLFFLPCFVLSSVGLAEIQGPDDLKVHVESGVDDTRFESDRMELSKGEEAPQPSRGPGMRLKPQSTEGFKLLETEDLQNSLPDPVSSRSRVRESNARIQSVSAPVWEAPTALENAEDSEAGGGLFWAFVAGVALVFVVLFVLLNKGGGDENDTKKKKRVRIR